MWRNLIIGACLCLQIMALDDTLPPGASVIQFRYDFIEADDYFDTHGLSVSLADDGFDQAYEGTKSTLEYEVGIAHGMSIEFRAENWSRKLASPEESFKSSGTGDVYVGLRQRLSPMGSSHILISEFGVSSPTGYNQNADLPLGSGGVNWYAIMTYGQQFHPWRSAVQMDIGYVFRNERPDDEVYVQIDLDFGITSKLWLQLGFYTEESSKRSLIPYDVLAYPSEHGNQYASANLLYHLGNRWHVEVNVAETIDGRNQLDEQRWGFAIGWRNQK